MTPLDAGGLISMSVLPLECGGELRVPPPIGGYDELPGPIDPSTGDAYSSGAQSYGPCGRVTSVLEQSEQLMRAATWSSPIRPTDGCRDCWSCGWHPGAAPTTV